MLFRVVIFALIHFCAWYALAHVAFGMDFDRLPDRSSIATFCAYAVAVLQYPHDLLFRLLPTQLFQQVPQAALALIALTSLIWGIALSLGRKALSARKTVSSSVPTQ